MGNGSFGYGIAASILSLSIGGCTEVTTVDLLPPKSQAGAAGLAQMGSAGSGIGAWGGSEAAGGTTASAGTSGFGTGPRLVNRYDFSGTGTIVVDSVSARDGEVMGGATLDGSGQLNLTGDPSQYVKLPSWLISSLKSVTIVTWFTWSGGSSWQSLFNFGYNAENLAAPSERVLAEVFFTPQMIPAPGASLHVDVTYGGGIDFVNTAEAFPVERPVVVAAVLDGDLEQISLYIDGVLAGPPDPTSEHLSELKDANCWLGQSQWAHDVANGGNFRGTYDEFRIYAGALSGEQIARLSLTDPLAL